ncbi:O-antigen ligase family protein [Roseicyclus marinus]|uniref:O-antigen ligase family protein n=1 Tax=Roseicyclus marinus TaxID=2161673 RepID=UPI0024102501|nr:O-antigen ligase family protein [Roseicyclus marinus]MDG3042472.1 O-antigen ligase family protein [Roseicyclus marinus]
MINYNQRAGTLVEVLFLSLAILCIPLFEAPKNIFSALFLIAWVMQAVRTKSLGANCVFNWPIVGLAAVLWLAPMFSAYGDTITPLNSAPRWTLLALFVIAAAQLDYSRSQLLLIWAALLVGGLWAVVESFWVWSSNGKDYPEFRSVGHVNHSSMYTLVTLAAGLGALYLQNRWLQVLGLLAIASTLAFLPPSRSLVGGVAVTAVLIFAISIYAVWRWSLRGLPAAIAAGVIIVAGALMTPPAANFRAELAYRVSGDSIFSGRDTILNSALAVWDRHPILGTGWFSFGPATSEGVVREAVEAEGLEYDPNVYWHYGHGHNLWTTMLIERGLVGIVLVTLLLFLYFRTFLPIVLGRDQNDPVDRGIAVGGLLVAVGFVVAGLGNTTMMNEHGQAGMAFIAVAYGYLRGRGLLGTGAGASHQV